MPEDSQDQVKAGMSDEELLQIARRQFEEDDSDEKAIREQALLDLRFESGDQWDTRIKQERQVKGRPALTFNRCHTFVQQVSNEARQNKPQIKFVPGDNGDPDTAEVKEGIARHIQYCSDAQIAYETAVEYAAASSFGYFRFLTDYVDPDDEDNWDQELKVISVLDPSSIYGVLIPSCFGMEPQHAFVIEEMPLAEYKRQYPDTEAAKTADIEWLSDQSHGWIGTDTVRIAEYWYVEHTTKEVSRKNPQTGKEETRTIDKCQVKFCKINGYEVIEGTKTDWPGYCIPIVPVLGKQRIVDGKPMLFSVIRFQRDPQQLINFYKTRVAEVLGMQPISPFFIPKGGISKEDEPFWKRMNQDPTPFLYYNTQDANGQPVAPPTRNAVEPPIQAYSAAAAAEIDDMKATAGIYDASLGAQGNETSGLGILRRQQQSNITNMHFMDNLERAFKKGGLIIADVMPVIYDAPRMVRILGADEAPKIMKINAPYEENGKMNHYKVGGDEAGKYDVVVTMGRAFSTKRMESFDMMTQVLQTSPNLLPMIGDIFFRNSDMAGSDQLADRFKKMLPPNLQSDDKSDPQSQLSAMQAQVQQMQQAHQALNAYAQQLEKEKEAKVIEMQSRERIAQMQEETKRLEFKIDQATKISVAQINASKDVNEGFANREQETYHLFQEHAHEVAMQAGDQAHDQDLAAQQHDQALEQGDQAAQNQAALAQQQAQQVSASPANG